MNHNEELEFARELTVKRELYGKGWIPMGCWRFMSPSGTMHDLSAADLGQLERIEKEGLFLVAQ